MHITRCFKSVFFVVVAMIVSSVAPSCSDDESSPATPVQDASLEDGSDAGSDTAADMTDEWTQGEFDVRTPGSRVVTCEGMGGDTSEEEWPETDTVCHFVYEGTELDLYVQANPVECDFSPIMEVAGAWVSVGGNILPVVAQYDWGSNHHNDTLTFTYEGQTYGIGHSSIGFGFRSCAPVDCIRVCEGSEPCDEYAGTAIDGCAREPGDGAPPLPVTCVRVNADGTVPELLDPWITHDGQPDYPLLPCNGDM
jgi:hypothetical protein